MTSCLFVYVEETTSDYSLMAFSDTHTHKNAKKKNNNEEMKNRIYWIRR